MKICVAQTNPITGDVQNNIDNQKKFIALAVDQAADVIIFPELSLTGYEPTLAQDLAMNQDDRRLDCFQIMADAEQITIGVGAPIKNDVGIWISLILFQPNQARQLYSKQYLHADEEPFFVSGPSSPGLIGGETNIALAICYELSVPEHAARAFSNGAQVYIASVAKFVNGVEKAGQRLAEIANMYSMTVLMANCVGMADGGECAGQTAVWDTNGLLLKQLDDTHEGLIIFDSDTQELIIKMI